jgi:hypothetical protein
MSSAQRPGGRDARGPSEAPELIVQRGAMANKQRKLTDLFSRKRAGFWVSLLLFSVAFVAFIFSPVRNLGETQYTMMLGHTLLHHRTFALDRKELRIPDYLEMIGDSKVRGLPLEIVNGRIYKYAPPGGAVLALPFLVAASWFGLKPVDAAGSFNGNRELLLSSILAALLMAVFAVVCFHFAHLMLPVSWSVMLAVGATFGTQIWSTASRVLEADTWTVLLMLIALFLLVASEQGKANFKPILLASILAWCYFAHPTTAIPIVAITVYVWLFRHRYFWYFALTGATWFLLLLLYSWHNFGKVLPNYFQTSRLGFQTFWEALAGNLISPSRGLLIYVPVLVSVAFILVRYRKFIREQRLVVLGLLVALVHLLVISGFDHWWAGHSYGPRYWTSIVPWFVLLTVLGACGLQTAWDQREAPRAKLQIGIIALLAVVSIFIHARGALSEETRLWNARPYDVDLRAGRLWNWRYPQFLAGLVHPPLPEDAYAQMPLDQRVDFTSETATRFLWYGWSEAEPQIRWTEDDQAAFVFALDNSSDLTLIIRAAPFVMTGVKESQRVVIKLNGEKMQSLTLNQGTTSDLMVALPRSYLKRENVVVLNFPDAESPAKLGLSDDRRRLGLAVQWIEFRTTQ